MIAHARDYIKTTIKALDPRFVSHKEPNTSEGIGASRFEQTYWFDVEAVNTTYNGNTYTDALTGGIEIAAKGGRDPITSHDDLWCTALKLRDRLVANKPIEFYRFEVESINEVAIASQDNWTKLRLQLRIETTYKMRGQI